MAKSWQYVLVCMLAASPLCIEGILLSTSLALLSGPLLGLATLTVPYLIGTYRLGHRRTLRLFLIGSSSAVAVSALVFSTLTGYNLTDEWWATPQYVSLLFQGHDWYSLPLRAGTSIWNVYLPLLPFIQVPFSWFDYRWFTLIMWCLMVYAVRRRYYTSITLGAQYPALMAASGFNDLVPLLFLTLAFVTFKGRPARAAEILSLGMKQFANIFVFIYHLAHQDWSQAGVTVVMSALFLLPFLLWDWKSAVCTPILYMPPDCQSTQTFMFNTIHTGVNFALWPVWVVAVFHPTLIAWGTRRLEQIRTGLKRFRVRQE